MLLVKVLLIKKACNFVLYFSKYEEITFSYMLLFVFIPYFVRAILSKKPVKSVRFGRRYKEGVGHIGGCL